MRGSMKTTTEQFRFYKSEVKRFLKMWGLVGWDAAIIHKKVDKFTVTQMEKHRESRSAVFTYNKTVVDDYTENNVSDSALHEVLELLLDKLESMVCEAKKDEAREEVHAIIQTIINVRKL